MGVKKWGFYYLVEKSTPHLFKKMVRSRFKCYFVLIWTFEISLHLRQKKKKKNCLSLNLGWSVSVETGNHCCRVLSPKGMSWLTCKSASLVIGYLYCSSLKDWGNNSYRKYFTTCALFLTKLMSLPGVSYK